MSSTSNNEDENDAKSEEIINLGINKENSEKDGDLLTDEEQEAKKAKNRVYFSSLKKNKRRLLILSVAFFLLVIFIFIAMAIFRSKIRNETEKNLELQELQMDQNIERKKDEFKPKRPSNGSNELKTPKSPGLNKNLKKSLDGIWELESQENMDEFFQEMGMNYFMRQIVLFVKPVIKLVDNGETWTMSVSGTPKAIPDVTFRDNVEFVEDSLNGKRKSYVIIESPQRHIQISKTTDKEVISVRELTSDDKMKLTMKITNSEITATRIFKRTG